MYPSRQTPTVATQSGFSSTDVGQARDGFRPVALPALAAAVYMSATAKKASETAARRGGVQIVHEDAPLV